MNKIKDIIRAIPLRRRIEAITAVILTVAVFATVNSYAWFSNQKKAAEMFKIKYPDSLYINAAHREDQVNFNLGQISMDEYLVENGEFVIDEETNQPIKVTNKRYIFSISGSNTYEYILQLSHTNNNMFTYTIYEAEEYMHPKGTSVTQENGYEAGRIVPASTADDNIITFSPSSSRHTENSLSLSADTYISNKSINTLYYVKGNALDLDYKNPSVVTNYVEVEEGVTSAVTTTGILANKDTSDDYYPYGTNTNVEEHAVPSYKQADIVLDEDVDIDSNKQFCKYYILEVTWRNRPIETKSKETDLVYISVERVR
ncbi:hypothetical protein [Ruminococcus flavefaciens]|uniref:hypothetical protein n=1 Tax=Ruminococcus flavefaciens TaxID=1265 RepID=UPI0026F03C4F|nr:hypothetical protein [Ruminococcus flavefaciens]